MKRRILVTGASKGIGQATAIRLAQEAFDITIHYRGDDVGAQKTLETIRAAGGQANLIQFDITDRDACRTTLEKTIEEHGAFYGIVNNAGVSHDIVFPSMEADNWDHVVHTNLDSFYNVLQPCIMPMIQAKQGGRIVTLSSVSGMVGNRSQVNYSAAKAGIIGATKALAVEMAERKITVNCVAPGLIETEMNANIEEMAEILKHIPARRIGQVNEVAELINYLMSDLAAYVTRQVISINGGLI